jgi:hypothetical protein
MPPPFDIAAREDTTTRENCKELQAPTGSEDFREPPEKVSYLFGAPSLCFQQLGRKIN